MQVLNRNILPIQGDHSEKLSQILDFEPHCATFAFNTTIIFDIHTEMMGDLCGMIDDFNEKDADFSLDDTLMSTILNTL